MAAAAARPLPALLSLPPLGRRGPRSACRRYLGYGGSGGGGHVTVDAHAVHRLCRREADVADALKRAALAASALLFVQVSRSQRGG